MGKEPHSPPKWGRSHIVVVQKRSSESSHVSIVWPHPDQEDHHIPVRWPQHEGIQSAGDYGQKERIQWKQQNSGQDCVKDQEFDGQ